MGARLGKITVGRAEVELIGDEGPFEGKPMAPYANGDSEQIGSIQKFRVTTTDGLNHVFGIVTWPSAQPEIISVERISGLEKYKKFESGGRVSIIETADKKWLAELKVLKYGKQGRPTPHTSNWQELSFILHEDAEAFLSAFEPIAIGTRQKIDGETNKNRGNLAIKLEPKSHETLAVAYALTKVLSIMHDLGLEND